MWENPTLEICSALPLRKGQSCVHERAVITAVAQNNVVTTSLAMIEVHLYLFKVLHLRRSIVPSSGLERKYSGLTRRTFPWSKGTTKTKNIVAAQVGYYTVPGRSVSQKRFGQTVPNIYRSRRPIYCGTFRALRNCVMAVIGGSVHKV